MSQIDVDEPPVLWRLLDHVGSDTLGVHQVTDDGALELYTPNPKKLVRALLDIIWDPTADVAMCDQAAIILGGGDSLTPLELVIPELLPALIDDLGPISEYAAMVLEVAAPAPGNEDWTKPVSPPRESLRRIAECYPQIRELVNDIIEERFPHES